MLTHIVGSCGAIALLSLTLGGEPQPAAPSAPSTPAAAAAAAQDPKPLPKVRIDYNMVKTLFGKDPASDDPKNPSTPEKVALG